MVRGRWCRVQAKARRREAAGSYPVGRWTEPKKGHEQQPRWRQGMVLQEAVPLGRQPRESPQPRQRQQAGQWTGQESRTGWVRQVMAG